MKRVVWFGLGAVAGAAGTVWVEGQVRRRLDALGPDHVVVVAGATARRLGRTVAEAVAEGRSTMREREDELRARRDRRAAHGSGAGSVAVPGRSSHGVRPPRDRGRVRPAAW